MKQNPKMKEVGMYQMMNFLDGLEGLTMALFTRALGWAPADVKTFLDAVRKDIKDKRIHSYINLYIPPPFLHIPLPIYKPK